MGKEVPGRVYCEDVPEGTRKLFYDEEAISLDGYESVSHTIKTSLTRLSYRLPNTPYGRGNP